METRRIGSTGERVTVVGLGGAALDRQSLAVGQATVRRALDLGVSYFDTAPCTGAGRHRSSWERHSKDGLSRASPCNEGRLLRRA